MMPHEIKRAEQQLEQLQEKERQIKAQVQQKREQLTDARNRLRERRLSAIGAAIEQRVAAGLMSKRELQQMLDQHVESKRDRKLLGLPVTEEPAAESAKQAH